MLRELHIKNFKAWADTGKIRMAPLTIFCGNNSSGKSSIAQFLLMLKQTVESFDRQRVLHLGDSNTLIDLGSFADIIHQRNEENKIDFGYTFDTSPIKIVDAETKSTIGNYENIKFESQILLERKNNKIVVEYMKYTLLNGNSVSFGLNQEQGKFKLTSENFVAKKQKGRSWPLPQPENFFGFPNEAMAYYQNLAFLQDLSLATVNFFKSIYYVGPLRDHPERFYQFSGEVPPHVGEKGKTAINALLAAEGRAISRGVKMRYEPFEKLIARWLMQMGLIHSFRVVPISKGRKEYEVRVRTQERSPEVLITDVGFGISQILPVIVQCFYVMPNSTLFFEQPEIHLHPSVQSHLGDLFIEAIRARENGHDRNMQIVIETHSEHLIRRVQRRIAEKVIDPNDVAIYFITQSKGEAKLQELKLDLFGNILNWPDNFFGNDLEDLMAMTKAAMERKTVDS